MISRLTQINNNERDTTHAHSESWAHCVYIYIRSYNLTYSLCKEEICIFGEIRLTRKPSIELIQKKKGLENTSVYEGWQEPLN